MNTRILSQIKTYIYATLIVALAGATTHLIHRYTHAVHLSTLLAFATTYISYRSGIRSGLYAATLSTILYLFAVGASNAPVSIANSLLLFGGSAVLTSLFIGRMRDQLRLAESRSRLSGIILDCAREVASASDPQAARERLAHHLAKAAGAEAVVRPDLRAFCEEQGLVGGALLDGLIQAEMRLRSVGRFTQKVGPWHVRSLVAGDSDFGVAAWKRSGLSDEENTLLAVLADTGALGLARSAVATAA